MTHPRCQPEDGLGRHPLEAQAIAGVGVGSHHRGAADPLAGDQGVVDVAADAEVGVVVPQQALDLGLVGGVEATLIAVDQQHPPPLNLSDVAIHPELTGHIGAPVAGRQISVEQGIPVVAGHDVGVAPVGVEAGLVAGDAHHPDRPEDLARPQVVDELNEQILAAHVGQRRSGLAVQQLVVALLADLAVEQIAGQGHHQFFRAMGDAVELRRFCQGFEAPAGHLGIPGVGVVPLLQAAHNAAEVHIGDLNHQRAAPQHRGSGVGLAAVIGLNRFPHLLEPSEGLAAGLGLELLAGRSTAGAATVVALIAEPLLRRIRRQARQGIAHHFIDQGGLTLMPGPFELVEVDHWSTSRIRALTSSLSAAWARLSMWCSSR